MLVARALINFKYVILETTHRTDNTKNVGYVRMMVKM